MPFEYEALVGHLYVVGGRSISAAPPGMLVEVAPVRAARGREADTFFVLVLPSGDALAPSAFYERLAQTAAEHYFDSTGSVTAGLREVFNYLNQNLIEYNQSRKDRTYEANLVGAVLRGDDLILARIGSGVVAVQYQGKTETLPADLSNDEALYGAPLGVRPLPDVKLSRHKIASGSRLVLADASLADFSPHQIREALAADEIGMMLVSFKELARLQLTLLAIEFVPPETDVAIAVREGVSTLEIAVSARAETAKTRTTAEVSQSRPRRRNPLGKTGEQISQRLQRGLAGVAHGLARGFGLLNRTIEHYFGAPEDGKRRWYTLPIATGVVMLLPVLIVGMVVLIWISSSGQSAYEQCIGTAQELSTAARSDPNASPINRRSLWAAAMNQASLCDPLRPGDPVMRELIREGQAVIDQIDDIERREARRLTSAPGALFDRVILQGRDMYLLDKTNGLVYQGLLSEDGLAFSRQPSPIPAIRTGGSVDGFVIGQLIDITFSSQDEAIFALDRNGVLIECDRRGTQACEAQQLLDADLWANPVALTVWGTETRIYILDPGKNQIWRYERSGSGYVQGANEYFAGQNAGSASVTTGVDLAISDRGTVYVLLSDGAMLRYESGGRIDFVYADFPDGQEITSAQSMFLDINPISQAIYIINRNNRTIYEVSWQGTRRNSFRITDESLFTALASVTADPGPEIIYAVSGNSVFAIEKQAPAQ
ncbi:MAG: hypothetical protein H7X77_04115 [Anaerolineae bacterium]|nr:hypothetical protein [Anaerolineae bacterium]